MPTITTPLRLTLLAMKPANDPCEDRLRENIRRHDRGRFEEELEAFPWDAAVMTSGNAKAQGLRHGSSRNAS